ncbi:MAG TPA: nuclear transport factor 2 family protein [Saprospiraceae bacterium]|nr:nuclear transport factor 2 family protein [Saprospiraceae bacterium]HNT20956.1 nuclear transport factor 2 family protein [Saprospiraceae bacterium]
MKITIAKTTLWFLVFTASALSAQKPKVMEQNKALIRAAYEALNMRNFDLFFTMVSPEFTDYTAAPMPVKGRENIQPAYEAFMKAFPDMKFTVIQTVNEGNKYYTIVKLTGTNTGSVMGMLPPTGKKVEFTDVDVIEMDGAGKALSHAVSNPNLIFEQIGYGFLGNSNAQAVMDIYKKFGSGDVNGILSGSDPDLMFEIDDRVFDYGTRWYKGKKEVAQFFKELNEKFKYEVFEPYDFVASGDNVYCRVKAKYTHLPSGKRYESHYTHHFKFKDGKVILFRGMDGDQSLVKM